MYERSAIVLERYFENYLDYRRECNLRDNFSNYCELVLKLEKYQVNYQKEYEAIQEYNESLRKIKSIQLAQEKLYKRSAKLEYNRNILFNSIDGKPEEIRKCIETIEDDVQKNNEAMIEEKEKLLTALVGYNDKRFELSKCKRYKKMAENDFNEIYEVAKTNFEGITEENIKTAKGFTGFNNNEEIVEMLEKNGKDEKIPFNIDVITDATSFGIEMAKSEIAAYLVIYEKMAKLLKDIEEGNAKIEEHKNYLQNEKAKVDFIYAAKDYIVQFLDYERMTVIHGRKSHNRLMSEACESFNTDVIQINNLYELLLKEINGKATKKSYKDLYNKSYLIDIQEKEEKFKKEKNRVNLNTATLINSNYWRIEGIRSIYTIFYKNVSEVFGRDVEEFDIPQDFEEENINDSNIEEVVEKEEKVKEEVEEKVEEIRMPFETKIIVENTLDDFETEDNDDEDEEDFKYKYSQEDDYEEDDENEEEYEDEEYEDDESVEDEDIIDNDVEDFEIEDSEEFDIFGEKYKNIEFSTADKMASKSKNIQDSYELEDEVDDEEENLLVNVKKNNKKSSKKNEIEDIEITKEPSTKKNALKKIRKITNVKKNMADDIW